MIDEITEVTTETWYLRKDGRHFDMRFKSSKEQLKRLHKPWWDRTLQKVAEILGAPNFGFGYMSWRNYLHPIKQIRRRITGIWYL